MDNGTRLVIFSGELPIITTTQESDQLWHIRHRDGRHVAAADRGDAVERLMIMFQDDVPSR